MKAFLTGAGLAALLVALPATAQPPGGPPGPMDKAMMQGMMDRQFQRLDTDHDGVISKAEFDARVGMMGGPGGPPPGGPGGPPPGGPGGPGRGGPGGMRGGMMGPRWFDMADSNRDGKVSAAESAAASAMMFDRMDANHDGTITPDERGAPPPPPPPPPQG